MSSVSPPRSRDAFPIPLAPMLIVLAGLAGPVPAAGAPAPAAADAGAPFTPAQLEEARLLRERCLVDDAGYETLRSLTREVGPRFAGSPGDASRP